MSDGGRKKILSIVGTRPEAIKMAPVVLEMAKRNSMQGILCSTGQHRQILDQSFELFNIKPDLELSVMESAQTLGSLTGRLFSALEPIFSKLKPDGIMAQGDTTSVFVAAVMAFYHRIPLFHVEAGLRTDDLRSPFPEEFNRRVADLVSARMFAPTAHARDVLISEGHSQDKILLTGNTIVDALQLIAEQPFTWGAEFGGRIDQTKKTVLVTVHRRENFGANLRGIFAAILNLSRRHPGLQFVLPVHPNPNVKEVAQALLAGQPNIILTEPLKYNVLINLMRISSLILTDSGGIQEEAPSFGVPLFVLRESTERPEGVASGVAKLLGASQENIEKNVNEFFADSAWADSLKGATNPYGDGKAAQRILDSIENYFRPELGNKASGRP
jgi:UDP-N-acetylglucosamine 2-epimerase (non-hydrolysing)